MLVFIKKKERDALQPSLDVTKTLFKLNLSSRSSQIKPFLKIDPLDHTFSKPFYNQNLAIEDYLMN